MAAVKFKITSVTVESVRFQLSTLKVTYTNYTLPAGTGNTTLQYSTNGGSTWLAIANSGNTVYIANLAPGKTYNIQLRVTNWKDTVAISDSVKIKLDREGKGEYLPPANNTSGSSGSSGGSGDGSKVSKYLPTGTGQQPTDNNGNVSPKSPLGLHGYQWNLPPHQWSMPIEPSRDPLVVNSEKLIEGSSHKFRRGRIYWYSRVDSSYLTSKTYNSGSDNKDPRYGFQFLWNPSQIETQVAMNLSVTPSFADKFVSVAGAFPSGEYLSFTLRIDRTNDFACIKSIPKGSSPQKYPNDVTTYDLLARFYAKSSFYSAAHSLDADFSKTFTKKIKDLQKYGTLADIEYLYKAINGPGWVNQATGRKSSDIGFLSPTLLRVDIGPLSYLGYVNSMAISHISFSKNMVPMISEVSIQFNLMATAGLATK